MNPPIFAEVNWPIKEPAASDTQTSNKILKWKLSCDWSILCVWSNNSSPLPQSIKICRKSAKGEGIIKAKLSLCINEEAISKVRIYKILESGITFMEKKLKYAKLCPSKFDTTPMLLLKGHVDISYINDIFWELPPRDSRQLICLPHLSQDLAKLIHPEPPIAADVTLKCGSATFPAHKTILCARSPVFAAMFSNPMKESVENEVDITDISESIMETMLTFIYTGALVSLRESKSMWYKREMTVSSALDLVVAADKYQIRGLKDVCRPFLKENISPENVIVFLDMGDALDRKLKDFAMDYLYKRRDFSAILNTEAWKALKQSKPAFAIEILSSVVNWKDKKAKNVGKN